MTLVLGGVRFDHHRYDERGDVLYLNVDEPRRADRGLETEEGHGLHYDAAGALIGLILLNVRWTLEREGHLVVSWPLERLDTERLACVISPV